MIPPSQDLEDFFIQGAARVAAGRSHQLGLVLFGKKSSNYTFIAETDLSLRIVRFTRYLPREVVVTNINFSDKYRLGHVCPICLIASDDSAELFDATQKSDVIERILPKITDPIARCQILSIIGSNLSQLYIEYNDVLEMLDLDSQQKSYLKDDFLSGAQAKSSIWSRLEDSGESKDELISNYAGWSDDRLMEWLNTHYEVDDSQFEDIWSYYESYRRYDDDLLISASTFLLYWSNDEEDEAPIGKILSRCLKYYRNTITSDVFAECAASGFVTGRFFKRRYGVGRADREAMFSFLLSFVDGLTRQNMTLDIELRDRVKALPSAIIWEIYNYYRGDDRSRYHVFSKDELWTYVSFSIDQIASIRSYLSGNQRVDVGLSYYLLKVVFRKAVPRALAAIMRDSKIIPADVLSAIKLGRAVNLVLW